SLGNSSVNFAVRPWCKSEHYWDVKFGLLESIKKRFDAEGISIPFPQQDVHIISPAPKA
ncbi:mechanosensitive ion channel, partial [Myxococcota bacterium]|nr:mechanosensitive ion channel [Myxococcota bacterium]